MTTTTKVLTTTTKVLIGLGALAIIGAIVYFVKNRNTDTKTDTSASKATQPTTTTHVNQPLVRTSVPNASVSQAPTTHRSA